MAPQGAQRRDAHGIVSERSHVHAARSVAKIALIAPIVTRLARPQSFLANGCQLVPLKGTRGFNEHERASTSRRFLAMRPPASHGRQSTHHRPALSSCPSHSSAVGLLSGSIGRFSMFSQPTGRVQTRGERHPAEKLGRARPVVTVLPAGTPCSFRSPHCSPDQSDDIS